MEVKLLEASSKYPRRVVCLTEETTETLYRLGRGDLVVGVSGFTVRPSEARQKPKVSSFLDADFEKIVALEPDLVSDLQAALGPSCAPPGSRRATRPARVPHQAHLVCQMWNEPAETSRFQVDRGR